MIVSDKSADTVLKKMGLPALDTVKQRFLSALPQVINFVHPAEATRISALTEQLLDTILGGYAGRDRAVSFIFSGWPIYYPFQRQLVWSAFGLLPPPNADCLGAAVDGADDCELNKVKSALFLLMAYEFTGYLLIPAADVSIEVDDATVSIDCPNEEIRGKLSAQLKQFSIECYRRQP